MEELKKTSKVELDGRTLSFETGALAKQANGAVIVRLGDTVVLATACYKEGAPPGDFMPLTVDYKEYTYAGGRIPGGFFKREGRPTEKEILTCRLIDRPLRPSFAKGYRYDTQIIGLVLSADGENDPDVLAINGASCALVVSDIPFPNPIGAVRVSLVDGKMVINPTNAERDLADLDIVVAGTEHAIVMVEAGAREIEESVVLDALDAAHAAIKKIVDAQKELQKLAGKEKIAVNYVPKYSDDDFSSLMNQFGTELREALLTEGKAARREAARAVKEKVLASAGEDADKATAFHAALEDMQKKVTRDLITNETKRLDGRKPNEIRKIDIQVGVLPRTHGSSVFTRGETQALVTITLGTPQEAQRIEDFEGETFQRFMLHYNFPPFSVGEVKFMRGPARREIGHGNLARRALLPVLPSDDKFGYTIRCVSDILESNGSSSMASVCGGSLAMYDAGVPLSAPVAGVAMGLVQGETNTVVLSDIAGAEDHDGDMDFKVCGTDKGITALQMDIKVTGLSREIMVQALAQAREGRLFILDKMKAAIDTPRTEISTFAPRLYTINIPKDRIRDVIGSGGKTIRWIVEETGCKIEVEDDGKVTISSSDANSAEKAIEIIKGLTATPDIGTNYKGAVKRIEAYGAFIEILPGQDGLLHVSEIAHTRVNKVEDHMQLGDIVEVQVVGIEPDSGKIRLSRKPLLPPPTEEELAAARASRPERSERPGGDRDRGPRSGGFGGGGGDRGGRGPRHGGGGDRDRGPRRDNRGDRPERTERPASSSTAVADEGGDKSGGENNNNE